MFAASKILWQIIDPEVLLFVALLIGAVFLWTPWARLGRIMTSLAVVVALLVSVFPAGAWLYHVLENRFPPLSPPATVDGIVVLGGSFNQLLTAERDQVALKESVERLTTFVTLARHYPDARLVFVGGSASLDRPDLTESADAARLFAELGLDTGRVAFEARSRNTYENAVYALALAEPAAGEQWLLITSAFHMPRAVGCFRQAGWNVIAYPVDYRTSKDLDVIGGLALGSSLDSLSDALHEWVGLIAYRLMGRTSALFPSPDL